VSVLRCVLSHNTISRLTSRPTRHDYQTKTNQAVPSSCRQTKSVHEEKGYLVRNFIDKRIKQGE
jgi:hypothetical protein